MATDHVKMFVDEYTPIAVQVSKQTGIAPSVLLAQWGMESNYGRSVPGAHNLGNIKDNSGKGAAATDNKTQLRDKYLNFESPEAFGDYYAHLMRRLYPNALNAGADVSKYTEGLRTGKAGAYAEDPEYEKALTGALGATSKYYTESEEGTPKVAAERETQGEQILRERREREARGETEPGGAVQIEQVIDPVNAAAAGAGANVLGKLVATKEMPLKADSGVARDALAKAQIRAELAERRLHDRMTSQTPISGGQSIQELEMEAQRAQSAYQQIQREFADVKNASSMRQAPPPMSTPAENAATPTAESERFPGRASGPRVEGDSGVRNWTRAEAGQRHQMPEAILDLATDKTKDSPTGGKRLIDEDLRRLEKIRQIGGGDFQLTEPTPGQLMVPPEVAQERALIAEQQASQQAAAEQRARAEAELRQRVEADRMAQERMAQQQQMQYLQQQREIAKAQQAETQRRLQEAQRARTSGVTRAQNAFDTADDRAVAAQRDYEMARKAPGAPTRVLEGAGVRSANMGPLKSAGVGAVAGLTGAYSINQLNALMKRFNEGDRSPEVLAGLAQHGLSTTAAGAALVPAIGPRTARIKGAGMLGLLPAAAGALYDEYGNIADQVRRSE
jgi:hypothetical protein